MAGTLFLRNINRFHCERSFWFLNYTPSNKIILNRPVYVPFPSSKLMQRFESNNSPAETQKPPTQPTMKEKFKKAVSEYGSTVIIFHVSISLVSLGVCYLLISSGLDVGTLIAPMGLSGETANKIASNAGTFAIAYAVHKVFAPVRMGITLTATPFIVRYLRNIGVLKKAK